METLTQTLTPQEKKELFLTELENRIIKQLGDNEGNPTLELYCDEDTELIYDNGEEILTKL